MLLGTDGNEKWYLLHFEAFNGMSLTQYIDGRQCLNEFESLLKSLKTRGAKLRDIKRANLAPVSEDKLEVEQNLTGVSSPGYTSLLADGAREGQEAVDKAIENEAVLHHLANALAKSPLSDGVRPSIPEWSLAKNVVPSYYMQGGGGVASQRQCVHGDGNNNNKKLQPKSLAWRWKHSSPPPAGGSFQKVWML